MPRMILTQSELKDRLYYCPETGIFTRLIKTIRAKVGDTAGYVSEQGYVIIRINEKLYRAHRLAFLYMTGEFPQEHTDHINHVRHDNRWTNLRQATRLENQKNQSMNKLNKSGVMGVHWDKLRNKWQAYIKVNKKRNHLGRFESWFDAVCARKSAESKYHFHANHGAK